MSAGPIRTRAAEPARDAAACAAIYAPYVAGAAATFEVDPPSAETIAGRMAAAHAWLVAEDDAAGVVGYAYASEHRARAAYRWAADVAVYIDAGHHRRGVGRALYEPLFAQLRDQGLWTLCAGITQPNPGSEGLHRALGFELVGVYHRIGWKAGAWHDVGWWQLALRPGDPSEPV